MIKAGKPLHAELNLSSLLLFFFSKTSLPVQELLRRKREALKKYKLSEINAEDLMSLQQEGVFDDGNDDGTTFSMNIAVLNCIDEMPSKRPPLPCLKKLYSPRGVDQMW